jgi:hypothetical protein
VYSESQWRNSSCLYGEIRRGVSIPQFPFDIFFSGEEKENKKNFFLEY